MTELNILFPIQSVSPPSHLVTQPPLPTRHSKNKSGGCGVYSSSLREVCECVNDLKDTTVRSSQRHQKLRFPGGSAVKSPPASTGDLGSVPGSGRSPGGGHGSHSSILAWRIPQTEEPGGLQAMASQRARHNLSTKQQTPPETINLNMGHASKSTVVFLRPSTSGFAQIQEGFFPFGARLTVIIVYMDYPVNPQK